MFTGIVQGLIEVSEIEHMDDISRLRLNLAELGRAFLLERLWQLMVLV